MEQFKDALCLHLGQSFAACPSLRRKLCCEARPRGMERRGEGDESLGGNHIHQVDQGGRMLQPVVFEPWRQDGEEEEEEVHTMPSRPLLFFGVPERTLERAQGSLSSGSATAGPEFGRLELSIHGDFPYLPRHLNHSANDRPALKQFFIHVFV
ncbi:uncharacterized protein PHACADRAFT_255667 [Phanerochaete carnosa HHB-10118-sp]|uniref:Uncharacterized protein n=1 Tax=Phanerochaete carnosa (strain HHB-10118-sp) TaxID=650164 RepID=K5VUJ8_PHACS|nr:uncharacterized protein PHACADRAFT_255667 [Phanerochaete carnosa HHB-10118-sp]EKM55213.1 hypothetical protein PHACADRAFT_255667 [Phanerochaete carnosa HHB-10118-sp]